MNPLMLIKPLLGVAKPLLGLGGGLLNNPVTKLITEKTVGAINHKICLLYTSDAADEE